MPRADGCRSQDRVMEVPSPSNPLGVRQAARADQPALGAVVNAVVDALSEYGVTHLRMPTTPEKIWRAIQDGKSGDGDDGMTMVARFRSVPAALMVLRRRRGRQRRRFLQGQDRHIIVGYRRRVAIAHGQMLARYLADHIPGKPSVIVQSMPGAGSSRPRTTSTRSRPRTARRSAFLASAR